jgi:hypothetical protein
MGIENIWWILMPGSIKQLLIYIDIFMPVSSNRSMQLWNPRPRPNMIERVHISNNVRIPYRAPTLTARHGQPGRPENPGPGQVGLALWAGLGPDIWARTSGWAGFGLSIFRVLPDQAEPGFLLIRAGFGPELQARQSGRAWAWLLPSGLFRPSPKPGPNFAHCYHIWYGPTRCPPRSPRSDDDY